MSDEAVVEFRRDVFLSFAPEDEDFALGVIAAALRQSGAAVHHAGEFRPGALVLEELEDSLLGSRFVVVVLSPAYTADRMSQFEKVVAQHLTVEDRQRRLIPALYRPVPTPDLLTGALVGLDFTDATRWGRELVRLADAVGAPVPVDRNPPPCPYPGMVPFDAEHHEFFFGREEETEAIVHRIRVEDRLLVIGPSGSGKSSLVFAGVVPALATLRQSHGRVWASRRFRPGRDPNASLGAALGIADARDLDVTGAAAEIVRAEEADRLLIVADQLEELFTLGGSGRDRFATSLLALSRLDMCAVLSTMRADFYAELMTSEFWDMLEPHRFEVRPLGGDALRGAIRFPALEQGVYVEAALVEKLVDDAGSEPGMLPFIQETLRDLWGHVEWSLLPLSAYVLSRESYGEPPRTGLHLAIEAHANAAFAGLADDKHRTIARRIFLRLVQAAEGRPHVRRQRTLGELEQVHPDRHAVRATVDHLVTARLLTSTSSEEESTERKIDLSHEALIAGWPRFQRWIEDSREAEKRRARLADQADEWEDLERRGGLLDEVELGLALRWMESQEAERVGVDTHIRDFVAAGSRAIDERRSAEAEEEERRRDRRLRTTRRWLAAVSVVALAAVAAALFAIIQRNSARAAQAETKAVELAVVSSQLTDQSLDLALLLAVESYNRRQTPEATASLTTTLSRLPALDRILRGHDAEVRAVAASPDGSVFASAGRDSRIILWSPAGEALRTLEGHTDAVQGLAFSPDGSVLVSSSDDLTVRRWDVATGLEFGPGLEGHTDAVRGVAIDSQDRWAASAAHDGTVRIWELDTGAPVATIGGPGGRALDVAFDPTGELLAVVGSTAADDGGEVIIVAMKDREVAHRKTFDIPVRTVSFDPIEGSRLALGLNDGGVVMWEPESSTITEVGTQDGSVFDVAFNADGTVLASAGRARTIQLHDVTGAPELIAEWSGHAGDIRSIAFLPDGRLVSGSRDRTVMLWNPAASHPFSQTATTTAPAGRVVYSDELDDYVWLAEHGEALGTAQGGAPPDDTFDVAATAIASSPATATLAVGHLDGSLTIGTAGSPNGGSAPMLGHTAPIAALAFSADGALLGVGDASGALTVWSVEEQRMLHESELPEFGVVDVALDGHGGCLIATDTSGALWQWCYGAQAAPELVGDTVMRGDLHGAGPLALDYSARLLAVGTDSDQIQVWDLGHDPATVSHVIDADGSVQALATAAGRVAAKSDADTVGVWDIGSGRSLGTIPAPDAIDVALKTSGDVLAVAGPTGLVLWDLGVQALTELACRVSNRNLTQSEWDFYVGGDYELTCPGFATSNE